MSFEYFRMLRSLQKEASVHGHLIVSEAREAAD